MRTSHGVELSDIFRRHGPQYRESHPLPSRYLRVMRAVKVCRTAVLGGHKDKCDNSDCDHIELSYNSCRNRHCPKCQTLRKERWIEARVQNILPIQYFHVVFSIPSKLNPIVIMNQKVMYNLLFRCVSETLMELSINPRHLGAKIGFTCILHTRAALEEERSWDTFPCHRF
jgi:Transposase zinc-binding domain